jgi:hypothetical protein
MARLNGPCTGDPLVGSIDLGENGLCTPGCQSTSMWSTSGFSISLELPCGILDDPALAPFLHPASDGSRDSVLRLRGVVTAME